MRYVPEEKKSQGSTPGEVLAINSLLSLTGMLLGHHAEVKGIKSDADIAGDELRFKIKQQQQDNDLALEKLSLDLALKEMDSLDKKLESAEATFEDLTHVRYKYPDEEKTVKGEQLIQDNKDTEVDKIGQLRIRKESELTQRRARLKGIKDEMRNIQPAIDFVHKNYSSSVAGDKDIFGEDDYDATVSLMKEALNITDTNEYMDAWLELDRPGAQGLVELNKGIIEAERTGLRFNISVGAASSGAQAAVEVHINTMMKSFKPAENGDDSPKMEELNEKVDGALKSGDTIWGKSVTNEDMAVVLKNDILTAVSGGMVGFGEMIKDYPWLEQALQELFPMQWREYLDKKKRWKGISTGAVSKPSQKSSNNNTNVKTIDSEAAAGKALGYFNFE